MRLIEMTLVIAALTAALHGQRTTAGISGTIVDQTGAVIAGAQVTAVQTSTGTTRKTTTNAEGIYVLSGLLPGRYTLNVEHPGFQTYEQSEIELRVGQAASINVSLQVGSQAELVTVTGETPLVDVRTATLSTVITPAMARELPLNGRNILQLLTLAPDVSAGSSRGFGQSAARPEAREMFTSASGGRSNQTSFYLDGGINEDPYTLVANVFPNPDAIEEFSFNTNGNSAKFGGRGGGVVNAATRSGSNEFHGSAFEFLRNHKLNARNFFAPANDGLKRNQYGFSFGGPVRKDQTFFFASWQGTKTRSRPTQNIAVTPTAAQRAGDFSLIPRQVVDPDTMSPFAGNQVPVSRLDPIATEILKYVPVGAPGSGIANYSTVVINNDNQWVGRIDHTFNERVRVFGRYLYDRLEIPAAPSNNNYLAARADVYYQSQNATLNFTYIPKPNVAGYVTATFNRGTNIVIGPKDFPGATDLGINIVNMNSSKGGGKVLGLGIAGYFGNFWNGIYRVPRNQYNLNSNWSYLKGTHTIEFGGELLREENILEQDYQSEGYFIFNSRLSGDNLLDFMVGKPSRVTQISPAYESLRRTYPALYITDSWKVNRKLTLSLGVRWNPWKAFNERDNQTTVFDETAFRNGVRSVRYPNLPPGLFAAGDPGVPIAGVRSFHKIIDPRVGLAIDPFGDGKTSIRAGYGMYHDLLVGNANNAPISYPPWAVAVDIPFPFSLGDPYRGRVNPFPAYSPFPPSQNFTPPFVANGYDPGFVYPTIQQWNFMVERQLPGSYLVRAAYIGMASYHLFGGVEANPATYIPGQSTFQNVQQRRPMGQYFTSMSVNKAIGTASFNALTITAEKRMARGLSFLGGFRWAKALDQLTGTTLGQNDYTTPNPKFDRGRADFDVSRQLIFSYVWELPSPGGLGFVGKHVLGGWRTSGIATLRVGYPFSVLSGLDYSYSGIGRDRADLIGDPRIDGGRSTGEKLLRWFNTSAFASNAPGTFGTSGRNILRGPGFGNLDFAAMKAFALPFGPFREQQRIDFRAEFFNIFNHPNFGNPNGNMSNPLYGRITSASTPRILQFALRYSF